MRNRERPFSERSHLETLQIANSVPVCGLPGDKPHEMRLCWCNVSSERERAPPLNRHAVEISFKLITFHYHSV